MSSRSAGAVRIDGLRDLQRDLKAFAPDARRDVTRALKEGAGEVARAAGPLSAWRSGKLAGSWRPGASTMKGYVRSRLPYAGVIEYGGTIRPKGAPVEIKAHPAGTRALQLKEDGIVEKVGDALMRVAARHGWS
jgi:Bacteriophage HK97-gp10, putative tail-component